MSYFYYLIDWVFGSNVYFFYHLITKYLFKMGKTKYLYKYIYIYLSKNNISQKTIFFLLFNLFIIHLKCSTQFLLNGLIIFYYSFERFRCYNVGPLLINWTYSYEKNIEPTFRNHFICEVHFAFKKKGQTLEIIIRDAPLEVTK